MIVPTSTRSSTVGYTKTAIVSVNVDTKRKKLVTSINFNLIFYATYDYMTVNKKIADGF